MANESKEIDLGEIDDVATLKHVTCHCIHDPSNSKREKAEIDTINLGTFNKDNRIGADGIGIRHEETNIMSDSIELRVKKEKKKEQAAEVYPSTHRICTEFGNVY